MPTLAKYNLIRSARTAAYAAAWNQDQPSRVIPAAMKAARGALGLLQGHLGTDALRAAVWDAIWTACETAEHFRIVRGIPGDACVLMASFNATEYLGCPGLPYAIARACAWHAIADTRTYDTWNEAYRSCLRQFREAHADSN